MSLMQSLIANLKKIDAYRTAILLSFVSMLFGILREFLIVGLFGFTATNDILQLYLSIFYTIGLSIDAMRLSCLNLYTALSLSRLIAISSVLSLPFSIIIGLLLSYSTDKLNPILLGIAIFGSYLNLMAALLITYQQRNGYFLSAQLINVMPNFVLIPGIIGCYCFAKNHLISSIVILTSVIPVIQCLFLLSFTHDRVKNKIGSKSFFSCTLIFSRHFMALMGEQLFQIVARSAFFHYGTGYLSAYSIIIRIYSALRFILIDTFIGSRLANWQKKFTKGDFYLARIIRATLLTSAFATSALLISLINSKQLFYSALQITIILTIGFYFSTLVRIIYFKINHHESNNILVLRFASFELMGAGLAFLLTKQLNYPILALLWIGYIAKPFAQLLLLRKRFYDLVTS